MTCDYHVWESMYDGMMYDLNLAQIWRVVKISGILYAYMWQKNCLTDIWQFKIPFAFQVLFISK